ncbi:Rqc2 family fibronectin-binding protein [Brochothrix thermosphacta]|uniref:Rqc2 family fibronectin-binding protein n=1 Tax=Brochothrix thermosphacta TaxID=2756 RepID=UPI003F97AEF8
MAFDSLFLSAMTQELTEKLVGGRIMRIQQPYSQELIFVVRNQRKNHKLLISAHPTYARIQISDLETTNPAVPPNFCMILRKYIESAVIESIEQVPNERILKFNLRGKNEIGDERLCDLYVEIMGRYSNILLVDKEKGTIIDCIKHVSMAYNSYRTLLPNATYLLPPAQTEKIAPKDLTVSDIEAMLADELPLAKRLVQVVAGFSPLFAREVVAAATDKNDPNAILIALKESMKQPIVPTWTITNNKEDFYHFELATSDTVVKKFDSLSELLDNFYADKARRDRVHQIGKDIEHMLQLEINKAELKITKLNQTLEETTKAHDIRLQGELLTTYMHEIKKGMSKIRVVNYYDDEGKEVTITLDPLKTPSQNAQAYFNKYQKLKTAVIIVAEQIAKTEAELLYLNSVAEQVHTASPADIDEIRDELIEQGYLRAKKTKNNRVKKAKKPNLHRYVSSDGTEMFVGRNNIQNDYLTHRFAHKMDTWLHVKDLPGSHVIVKSLEPSQETLEEAANIAGYYSKASLSSQVPVDYTLVKHVHKPNGAKPGYVIYDHQTTLFVTPDKELVESLEAK